MMDYFFGFFENLVRFQVDRFLTGLLCIFAVIAFLRYEDIIALKRGRNHFRLGGFLFIALIGLTVGMHLWRLPRGLSGTYYTNPSWSGEPVKLKRLFDSGKQNIDRVINLESHDFKRLARRTFSVIWQGYVYSPDEYHLDVLSNFDTWLYVDDILIDSSDKIDFDAPEACASLSPGVHHIMLKALQAERIDPFIQLVWQSKKSGKQEIIPEDFLFPKTVQSKHIRQKVTIEHIVLGGITAAKGFLLVMFGSLFIILIIRKIQTIVIQNPKKLLIIALLILLCLLFIHLRYVCESPQRLRTFLFFSYCFFLSAPCLYLVLKVIFPKFLRTLFFIFYLLLALFPYKLFFPEATDLCVVFTDPSSKAIFGLDRYWILIMYGVLSLVITGCWLRYHKREWIWPPKKESFLWGFMLIIAVLQIAPRLDENSPRMRVQGIDEHGNRRDIIAFFDHYVMGDVYHHTYPNGIFKGVDDTNNTDWTYIEGRHNNRGLNPYLYSLIEPFMHPYYAAILMNGVFFYSILLAGYTLAKHFNLDSTISLIFPIVLSASFLLLYETVDTSFYIQKHLFPILILVIGYKFEIYSPSISLTHKFLFCMVLACSALVHYPYTNVVFIFLWGLFHAISQLKVNTMRARLVIFRALVYASIPIISLSGFEMLLRYYHLAGDPENVAIRDTVFSKLFSVPDFIVFNVEESIVRINKALIQLLFINPVRSEYLYILGAFGIICFFSILPKYLKNCDLKGVYAMYSSGIILPLIGSFAAYVPPESPHAYAYTLFDRAAGPYTLLVLAQCIGIYHAAKLLCHWLPAKIKPKYVTYAIVLVIVMFSFYMKPGGGSILFQAFE